MKIKKMKIQIITVFFLIIFQVTFVKSQSLNELVEIAMENNTEIKILENEYRAALEKAPQAGQLPDPEVGVGVFPLPVETRLGAQITRFSATQRFPWFGTLDSKKNLEISKAEALYEKIEAKKLNIPYQVKKAFFKLYEIQQSKSIITRNITILNSLEKLTLAKVASGKTTSADVLRIQIKTEELKQELEILETEKSKPVAEINRLLNRPVDTPVFITDTLSFAGIPFDKDTIVANIQNNHPVLKMFELQQDVAQQKISINELNGKPSFGVGLDYIFVSQRENIDLINNGRDILQLKASVKIPLFREKYNAKEREENLNIAILDDKKTDMLSKFSETIEKAFSDYETAKLRISLYNRQIELTKAAIKILQTEYSTRGKNFDELLRLENDLINYDLKKLKAIIKSHIAKSDIERFINL